MSQAKVPPEPITDLVQSFSKLILNASGDAATLDKFSEMLSNELERVSNKSTKSDPTSDIIYSACD